MRQLVLHATILRQWTIAEGENVIALFVFLGIALGVSRIVDTAARRATEAARARGHARTLARLAATTGDEDPVPALLQSLRSAFALDSVAVLRRNGSGWIVEATVGEPPITSPADAATVKELSADFVLALDGPSIPAEDVLVLNAFADQLADGDRARPAARRGRPGARPRRGQRAARRPAASGVARPAHAAGVDQGMRHEPAQPRRHVVGGGDG